MPHEIQNFGNSVVDISILGQFHTYLQFRGEKYLNTFIVTNTNDCPNLLSYGATFRMGVLLPNYPEENVVRGENVPNFKINTSEGTSASNVFQILQDLRLKQYQEKCHYFLYGKEFTLKTDQKPIVSIYKKHMIDISPRVQRLIVRSFPYLLFKVIYKKGTAIPVADALS